MTAGRVPAPRSVPTAPTAEEVQAITEDVWNSFIGQETPLEVVADVEFDPEWSASIAINGEWNGLVALELTDELSRLLVEQMLGVPADRVTHPDIADAIGELANMIGGNIKGAVPGPSRLSLPVVAAGRVAAGSDMLLAVRVPCAWADQPMVVTVHQTVATGKAAL